MPYITSNDAFWKGRIKFKIVLYWHISLSIQPLVRRFHLAGITLELPCSRRNLWDFRWKWPLTSLTPNVVRGCRFTSLGVARKTIYWQTRATPIFHHHVVTQLVRSNESWQSWILFDGASSTVNRLHVLIFCIEIWKISPRKATPGCQIPTVLTELKICRTLSRMS